MSGFLVEIRPGRELLYRTTWALREAMRSGEITPDSRIFHRATSQWISITEHPEYRRFLTDHDHPAWFQPKPADLEHGAAHGNGGRHRLSGIITRLAGSLAGLKRRLESAAPERKDQSEQPEEPKPVLRPVSELPSAPAPPPEPPKPSSSSSSGRDRWTFFP